ncbi:MAG: hypothetical protein L6416_04670 [Candidatus Omnitrophica bacterium]|nr:hypothetical protein [Candidatus Omnitrophota bacterium]
MKYIIRNMKINKKILRIIAFILFLAGVMINSLFAGDLSLLGPEIKINKRVIQQVFEAKKKVTALSIAANILSSAVREIVFLDENGFRADLITCFDGKTFVFRHKEEFYAHGGGRIIFRAYDFFNNEEKIIGHLDLNINPKVLSPDSADVYNPVSLKSGGYPWQKYPFFVDEEYRDKYYTGKLLLLQAVRYSKQLSNIKYLKYENPTDQVKRMLIEIFAESSEGILKIDKQEWRGLLAKERTQDVIADISEQGGIVFVNKAMVDEKNKMEKRLLPGVIDLNYAQLQKTLERFLDPNENFTAADLKQPELINLLEVQFFYDSQWQMIENGAGEYFFNLPLEKISGYFKDYLNELTDLENLAKGGINEKDIGPFELFVKLQQVVNAREKIFQRWKAFANGINFPEAEKFSQLFADKSFDMNDFKLKTIMLKYPGLRTLIERSLGVYYKDFLELENILKDDLKSRITAD